MDPHSAFCANPDCPARGQSGQGNIKVHSHKDQRFRCTTCGKTFAASKGTPFYRLHKDRSLFACVSTLLTHGCPLQAVVAAFGLDERTVAAWHHKAGSHCQDVHQHHLNTKKVALQHTQADELYAKCVGGRCWLAMAMSVPHRLWLGGVVSPVLDLVGGVYNFCASQRSLRVRQEQGKKWLPRTPAMAAAWTDHVWSIEELLSFKPPLPLHG